ncbi:MAG TPA: hypothetical protein VMV10_30010 [Pirellulales bacterium]|nr:hypothetical protein [Pirellulales bacterium]
MQFNEWVTLYAHYRDLASKSGARHNSVYRTFETFYDTHIKDAESRRSEMDASHLHMERAWYSERRPYYNVYPKIIPHLTAVRLDCPVSVVEPPVPYLLVRLPAADNPLSFAHEGRPYNLRGILFGVFEFLYTGRHRFDMWLDIGETGVDDRPVYTLRSFNFDRERSVEEAINEGKTDPSINYGVLLPTDFQLQAIKLVCCLCLLRGDPDVIEPDVLVDDQDKYEQTGDQRYVEKAHRRGKVGWTVGKQIEKAPHWRRPHFALFWTGKGRTIPKIGLRKGAIVKRAVVGEIPTGYLDDKEKPGAS